MSYLSDNCTFRMFTPSLVADGAKFVCGDSDLDEFFHEDAFLQAGQLLCKNYCFTSDKNPNEVVCVFTLANDSIKKIPGSRKKKVEGAIPRDKHYASYPAVMIGRLGVSQLMQGKNLGTEVLDFIKAWLVDPMNKTGCRFVLVDSYNQDKNFKFYERNGFKFLFSSEEQEREFRDLKPDKPLNTRLMYFDLIELLN